MSLSCDCDIDYFFPYPGDVIWYSPSGYSTLNTARRCRCVSCKELIDIGSLVGEFPRYKIPDHDVEIAIYGDEGEIQRAPYYMCEGCTDIYFSITELGYCISGWDMRRALKDYQQLKKIGLPL